MTRFQRPSGPSLLRLAVLASMAATGAAQATVQLVQFNTLNVSTTLPTPFMAGDVLRLDTLVLGQTGALGQTINFTVGADAGSFTGRGVWEVSSAAGAGPRLVGVNIDLLDAGNALVNSDSFVGVTAGFAVSSLGSAILPGNYSLTITGTGVRASSLDVTLEFVSAVPEPTTWALLLAGLGGVAFKARRRAR